MCFGNKTAQSNISYFRSVWDRREESDESQWKKIFQKFKYSYTPVQMQHACHFFVTSYSTECLWIWSEYDNNQQQGKVWLGIHLSQHLCHEGFTLYRPVHVIIMLPLYAYKIIYSTTREFNEHSWMLLGTLSCSRHGIWLILLNDQLDAQFFFLMCLFQSCTCFEQPSCSSSGASIVSIQLWYMSLCVSGRLVRRSGSSFQKLHWHNWFSWWWARGCSKHVEDWNKHIRKKELCFKLVIQQNYTEMHG
jgi:hypothetical protein